MYSNLWQRLFPNKSFSSEQTDRTSKTDLPSQGIYHFEYRDNVERSRIHLRIDGEPSSGQGHGMLLVNANRVIHLNPTATLMAYLQLSSKPDQEVIRILKRVYQVSDT
ncbi:MAG: hypothetical protein V3U36_01580, partial [Anaerolineales bacterium]